MGVAGSGVRFPSSWGAEMDKISMLFIGRNAPVSLLLLFNMKVLTQSAKC